MKIYEVGGAIRDSLLGKIPKDKDWVVVGSSPEEMVNNGFKPIGKDFPVFLHPETNEEYTYSRHDTGCDETQAHHWHAQVQYCPKFFLLSLHVVLFFLNFFAAFF